MSLIFLRSAIRLDEVPGRSPAGVVRVGPPLKVATFGPGCIANPAAVDPNWARVVDQRLSWDAFWVRTTARRLGRPEPARHDIEFLSMKCGVRSVKTEDDARQALRSHKPFWMQMSYSSVSFPFALFLFIYKSGG
jgi:hypothetical protein